MNIDTEIILNFLKSHKKHFAITITAIFLLIILTFLITYLVNKSWLPLENENLLSEVPSSEIDRFKHAVERELNSFGYSDVQDATVREDSISTTQEKNLNNPQVTIYRTSFLVDIDSIKQTYLASITWLNNGETRDTSASLFCPSLSESKYPDSECVTTYNTSHAIDLWLPHELTLDTGEKAIVKNTTIERNGKTLQIYLYSCDDPNPPLKATEEVVKSWVEDTVKDPLADKYQYHVRYGYCENDRF